ncbi:DUF5666 domain-containing protein [Aeromonas sp. XH]|uniref:DUF5666 domain-containing protein n=1 Tax=Aeromonas sp. XH TaxID=3081770 RepID=UPI0029672771|nr:DUF5666 domain-containing protein [Aeromonas sp. XH]WOX47326.1 DUF5666 domain-containing protein [Aeromonas sp. XH]
MKAGHALMVLLSMGLSACGGGGGEETPPVQPPTPIPDTTPYRIQGNIAKVQGSQVFINGKWLDTQGANIRYAEQPWAEPLQAGMDVNIMAKAGKATQVTLNPIMTGQLATTTTQRQSNWQVNSVRLDQVGTGLQAGDWVMVFGEYTQQGQINVKKVVGLLGEPQWLEVENRISELDELRQSFKLGNITVSYKDALLEDGQLREGRWVEAFGLMRGNLMDAREIEIEDEADFPDRSELEGIVNYYDPVSGLLELSRQRQVWVTNTTRFKHGSRQDLKPGVALDVYMMASPRGPVATEIEFDHDNDQLESYPSQQFKLSGWGKWDGSQLTVGGIPFEIDGLTRFKDGLNRNNLDGRWLELDGMVQNGLNLVREIEPDDLDNSMELMGPVSKGSLWNYRASDQSLSPFEGRWIELDCYFDGNYLSNCRIDD